MELPTIPRSVVVSWVLAAVTWVMLIWLWTHHPPAYVWLAIEDNPGENTTALLYAVAAVAAFVAGRWARRRGARRRAVWLFLLGLFFFFVAGEEISWGQRLLRIDVPEVVKEHNTQGELNLHNVALFDKDRALISQQTVLKGFVLVYGLLLPWAARLWERVRRLVQWLGLPLVPAIAWSWFIVALLNWQTVAKARPHWAHSEVCELLIAVGFCLAAVSLARGGGAGGGQGTVPA